jgi:hypothetical protein
MNLHETKRHFCEAGYALRPLWEAKETRSRQVNIECCSVYRGGDLITSVILREMDMGERVETFCFFISPGPTIVQDIAHLERIALEVAA